MTCFSTAVIFFTLFTVVIAKKGYPIRTFEQQPISLPRHRLTIDELIVERLPRVAEFNSYDLRLFPHVVEDDFTFDGNVTIDFKITSETDRFFFYSKDLKINKIELRNKDGKALTINQWDVDRTSTLGYVKPFEKFQLNQTYQIDFQFKGNLLDATRFETSGLFYRHYKQSNKEFYTVATHFEPIAARTMFPCGDDPHFKAVFNLSVIYPKTATIFANSMPETEDIYDKDHKIAKFKKSPKMSTYLLAFAFGTYEVRETRSKSGVPIRAALFDSTIPKGDVDRALKIAANFSAQCLDSLEDLLKVPYGHVKLDNVDAIGLSTAGDEIPPELVATIICHETAHQWFGNLVTGDNWGQIFLHESFANFFQTQALLSGNILNPDLVNQLIFSNRLEGLTATFIFKHPLVVQTKHFDGVVYASGGAILRMIEGVFGSEKFYAALKLYLETHKFGTATHEDLISAFEQTLKNQTLCGDLSIREFLNDFFLQTYFPVISIDVKNNEYRFEQKSAQLNDDGSWNVPMFVKELSSLSKSTQIVWLLKNNSICSNTFKLKEDKQYNFNAEFRSFAKINETNKLWMKKLQSDFSGLNSLDKLGLVGQACSENAASFNICLPLVQKVDKTEQDHLLKLIQKH
ncbi:Thyrotropin-releasing hormone-degrading ectoenzyme [Aphelenchoides bicaudatus]|nr:Thyrotropin-releasing hormone-degrading ectoenzyme [Aphelenchoides bicaudatus]